MVFDPERGCVHGRRPEELEYDWREVVRVVNDSEQIDSTVPANERQVGGDHYRKHGHLQHWDVVAHFGLDYFQAAITKYVMRWKDKGGLQDLEKARHYLDKYIELIKADTVKDPTAGKESLLKTADGEGVAGEVKVPAAVEESSPKTVDDKTSSSKEDDPGVERTGLGHYRGSKGAEVHWLSDEPGITRCGESAHKVFTTSSPSNVTCADCLLK